MKFIIDDRLDLNNLKYLFKQFPILMNKNVAVGTTGRIPAAKIVDFLLDNKLFNCVLNYQIHKEIWKKGKEAPIQGRD